MISTDTFSRLESEVRSYIRSFPTVFTQASGSWMTDEKGDRFLDFFSGAGTLNYGHNNPIMKQNLVDYLLDDGIVHGLDMGTKAKRDFLESFERHILKPRQLNYKIQFTGPTGTNAVEAALKLARQVKNRSTILCFTNAFHGVTSGSVAATGSRKFREATGTILPNTRFMPFDGYYGDEINTLALIDKQLSDASSGIDHPAAVLVETIQGEGGINVASKEWLVALAKLCKKHDMLLIVDDIQMGCGRTGRFFSFEEAGIKPDIVTLSKSLSGYGLPMAIVLMKPELDIWQPSAHNGTFRGNNAAFVTATTALNEFWADDTFAQEVRDKGQKLQQRLQQFKETHPAIIEVRGRGMVAGLAMANGDIADAISEQCFKEGLIIETCGPKGEVVKLLPALTISTMDLERGLRILNIALLSVCGRKATLKEKGAAA
ncbi:MAG: diaminobutyrate--2-oxoglutarate transaminase [Moraxellaceae bacterium]|nr:diaminobutyrate--2-oxoglutarate transaminase [Moraxellaceae bacterium]